MLYAIWLVLITIVLPSCAGTIYHTEWSRGRGLTEEQWASAQYAARRWCEATAGECCPRLVNYETGRHIYIVGQRTAKRLTGCERPTGFYLRCAYEIEGICRPAIGIVRETLADADIRTVLLHEFGHHCATGEHSLDPSAVMYATVNGAVDLTTADIEWYLEQKEKRQ